MTRPGTILRAIAQRVCSDTAMERVVDPALADLQREHGEAIRRRQLWRSRWIRLAGYSAFWKVLAITAARHPRRELSAPGDRAVSRTVRFSVVAVVAISVLLLYPALRTYSRGAVGPMPLLGFYLIPQVLVTTIPVGLTFGILSGLRGRMATPRVKRSVAALALVCFIATFVLAAWTMPAANQAFRELMAGRRLAPRGFNEMTLGELARTPAQNIWIVSSSANRLAFEFHYRAALAFGPLALGPLAMAVTGAWRGAHRVRGVLAAGSLIGIAYLILLSWARQYGFDADQQARAVVAWIPNLVFLVITLLLFRRPPTAHLLEVRQ